MKKEVLEKAIKANMWDKSTYGYAISAMSVLNPYGLYWDNYKLQEVKDEFYRLATQSEYFKRIKNFTTFKNL